MFIVVHCTTSSIQRVCSPRNNEEGPARNTTGHFREITTPTRPCGVMDHDKDGH